MCVTRRAKWEGSAGDIAGIGCLQEDVLAAQQLRCFNLQVVLVRAVSQFPLEA
jgi:hypothetical protein